MMISMINYDNGCNHYGVGDMNFDDNMVVVLLTIIIVMTITEMMAVVVFMITITEAMMTRNNLNNPT